jgi:hypothetical protein
MDISHPPRTTSRHSEAIPRGAFPVKRDRDLRGAGRGICCFIAFTLTVAVPAAAAAAELGRLFLSPQQRQDLDRRRATNRAEEEAPQIKEGPLTLEGHVQRSSGKTATWINGVPQYDSHDSRDPALVTVVPNAGEPGVKLKVGEIYERTSGEVRDSLGGGEISVGKSPQDTRAAKRRRTPAKAPAATR